MPIDGSVRIRLSCRVQNEYSSTFEKWTVRLFPCLFVFLCVAATVTTGEYKWERTHNVLIWGWFLCGALPICLLTIGGFVMAVLLLFQAIRFLCRFVYALLTT